MITAIHDNFVGVGGETINKKLTMKSFIGNLLFAAILLLIATRFLSVMSGTVFPIDIVTAGSMSPSLMEGDIVAWIPSDIDDVEVGDVIVFKSWLHWPGEKLIVHRVVEIKESWGKPALATKGDANDWTDQGGPHIPEPYVVEKNFIGKVLSIGKQPLKIPFIGIIGKWINDGFTLLSQPSAAKGTATYVGVFTPLTISVILLVISIFILPDREKNKTIREKIHFYIFGSQPLSLKKVFAFFLTVFVFLLILIHFFAYDSTSASVGIGEFPDESSLKLGSITAGQTSMPRKMPVINPGVMPVKGIIFGSGDMKSLIDRASFEVGPGTSKEINITATAPNGTKNGSYVGDIMIYSSPLWLMFPDEVMETLYNFDAESAVMILDILSACIFTCITIFLMAFIAFVGNKYRIWEIDLSWHYAPKLYLKKGLGQRSTAFKKRTKKAFGDRFGWINSVDLANIDAKPLILASIILIPLLFLLNSEILAMVIASIAAGVVAYYMSCKLRRKIVIASALSMIFAMIFAIVKTNYSLITSNRPMIESIALGLGAMGLYILVLAILLIPISLLSWYITSQIRNLKERKDPLLVLEGRCDL